MLFTVIVLLFIENIYLIYQTQIIVISKFIEKYFIGQVIIAFITMLSADVTLSLLSIEIILLFVCLPYFLNNNLVNDLIRIHSTVDTVRVSFYIISSYYSFNMLNKKHIDSYTVILIV